MGLRYPRGSPFFVKLPQATVPERLDRLPDCMLSIASNRTCGALAALTAQAQKRSRPRSMAACSGAEWRGSRRSTSRLSEVAGPEKIRTPAR